MRLGARLLWILLVVGCNEVTEPTTAPLTLTVTTARFAAEPRVRLEGVQLCETDTSNCELSDENGEVTIEVPFEREISYTLKKGGFISYLYSNVISRDGLVATSGMRSDLAIAENFRQVDSPYPERGTGHIAIETDAEGVTFDLPGSAAHKMYYENDERDWSLDLTATTPVGKGGFVEVSPGEYQVNLGGTGEQCVRTWGWPGDRLGSVRVRVLEGHRSLFVVMCPPPPP